jgi:hypothetical protein
MIMRRQTRQKKAGGRRNPLAQAILRLMGRGAPRMTDRDGSARAAPVRRQVLAPYVNTDGSLAWRVVSRLAMLALILGCLFYGAAYAFFAPYLLVMFPIPVVIAGLLVIWALPDMARAPTGLLEGLFYAYLVVLIVWPNYLAISLPGLPWITLLRLVAFPMAFVLLVCVSISSEFRKTTSGSLASAPVVWRMIVAFAVVQMVCIAFSKYPNESMNKALAAELNWMTSFFVAAWLFTKPGRAERWAALLCMTSLPIAVIAFWEFRLGHLPWSDHIPSFLKIQDPTVQRVLAGNRRGLGDYRIQSTFTTPLGLGEYVSLTVPFLLHFAAGRYRWPFRLAAAVMVPVLIEVVLLSDARLGLIGCVVAVLGYLFYWATTLWRRNRSSIFGPAIIIGYPVLAAALVASSFFIGRVHEKIWGSGQYDDSNEGRMEMYKEGIPMVLKHPWGYGPGMGASTLGITNPDGVLTIDTYYLLIGLEYGVLGFILYYGAIGCATFYAGRSVLRVSKAPHENEFSMFGATTIALVNYLIIKSVFSNDDNHPLMYMVVAMTLALMWRMSPQATSVVQAPVQNASQGLLASR